MVKTIKACQFFDYSVHEYQANLDGFSQDIIVAQIEVLLTSAQSSTTASSSRESLQPPHSGPSEELLSEAFDGDGARPRPSGGRCRDLRPALEPVGLDA